MRIGSERDLWIFGRELIRFSRDTRTCTVLCISYFLFGIWHLLNGFFYISETAPAIPGVAQTHVQQTSQRLKVNDGDDNDDDDADDGDDGGGDDDTMRVMIMIITQIRTLGVSVRSFIMSAFKNPQPTMKRIWVVNH